MSEKKTIDVTAESTTESKALTTKEIIDARIAAMTRAPELKPISLEDLVRNLTPEYQGSVLDFLYKFKHVITNVIKTHADDNTITNNLPNMKEFAAAASMLTAGSQTGVMDIPDEGNLRFLPPEYKMSHLNGIVTEVRRDTSESEAQAVAMPLRLFPVGAQPFIARWQPGGAGKLLDYSLDGINFVIQETGEVFKRSDDKPLNKWQVITLNKELTAKGEIKYDYGVRVYFVDPTFSEMKSILFKSYSLDSAYKHLTTTALYRGVFSPAATKNRWFSLHAGKSQSYNQNGTETHSKIFCSKIDESAPPMTDAQVLLTNFYIQCATWYCGAQLLAQKERYERYLQQTADQKARTKELDAVFNNTETTTTTAKINTEGTTVPKSKNEIML